MKLRYLLLISALTLNLQGQDRFSQLLKSHSDQLVPYMSVKELAMPKTKALIIDTREYEEFDVSHIPNAIYGGYNSFEIDQIEKLIVNKDQVIVVYCSIGIRSENIAKKLNKAGYLNVFNLYGGIFEWKNNYLPVLNNKGLETDNVHTFSHAWEKWLKNGKSVN